MTRHSQKTQIIAIIMAIILIIFITKHFTAKNNTPILPVPEVIVEKPQLLEVVDYITQTGNTMAFNSVNLVARVEGYLNSIEFVDGSLVKKDQLLFVIEPEPYEEKLKEAKASVAAQQASYDYDKSEYARQQRMYKENATSLNSVEKWLAKAYQSKAEVAKAKANEDIAAINYSYTHIKAPFDGRIGRHLVDPGNLVGNGKATDLATVEQIDPIYVYFNLNELDLFRVRAAAKAEGITAADLSQVDVYVNLQNESDYAHKGKLNFVNTGLNASTGTMEFRALIPNKDHVLLPGLFVQVRIAVTKPTKQLTVPDTAVLYDQIGAYVLITGPNNIVVLKRVQAGSVEKGRRAILKGIIAQDNVIVSGIQNASPGHRVALQEKAKAP